MINIEDFQVLNDNVLVRGIIPELRGGVVRGVSTDNKPEIGLVLKVGPGRTLEGGQVKETIIKVGMLILFNQHTTTKFNVEGTDYYVLREEDAIGYQEYDEKHEKKTQKGH